MEGDLSGLYFTVFLVHLVAHEDNWDVIADSGQVLVPLGDVLIGDPGCHIEHEDGSIGANIVAFSQTAKFLLASRVPKAELDGPMVCIEDNRADLNSLGGNIFLLELSRDVSLHEGRFSYTAVSDENDFELSDWFRALI